MTSDVLSLYSFGGVIAGTPCVREARPGVRDFEQSSASQLDLYQEEVHESIHTEEENQISAAFVANGMQDDAKSNSFARITWIKQE